MTSSSRRPASGAGLALILFPLFALILKATVHPGWMMAIIMLASVPLLAGYILQIVIASVSMFRARGVFNSIAGSWRGITAAWLTSVSALLAVFFLVDGGDDGVYGSAFTAILGTSSTAEGEQFSIQFFLPFAFLWIAGWVWLVVEWIVLSVKAKRMARSRALRP